MKALDSRLVPMETTLNLGGRSEGTSHELIDQREVPASSAEEAFMRREKLHFGSDFQVIGDLRNWTRGWSHEVTSAVRSTDFTRVLCLNVGGGTGTLRDPEKLSFIAFTLIQQDIHVACLTESRIKRNELTAALKDIGLERQFRAFGLNEHISWLVREPVADKVVSRLELEGGRIAGLVLAGACKQRTIIFGVYGFAGASTDSHLARRQKDIWAQLGPLIQRNRELKHHVVVLGDFNVLPAIDFTTSRKALSSSIEDFLTWQTVSGLSNVLLQGSAEASLLRGFFTRSRSSRYGVELSLLDHIFVSPGLANGSGILTLPAGAVGRTNRLGDHDAVVADLDLGFQPAPPLAKRPGIVWAHNYAPQDWNRLNTDRKVLDTIDTLLIELETAGDSIAPEALSQIFERILAISSPAKPGSRGSPMLSMPSEDPIFLAIGRMLGRLHSARSYVRSHLPRPRQTNMRSRFDRRHAHSLVFHVEDKWAESLADTADMRRSLRFNHCRSGADWLQWLTILGKVCQRLRRIAKHHRKLWKTSRRDFEVAKATQEGRAGKLRRAMNLIFPASSPGVADNAYWRKTTVMGAQGLPEEVWLFETDPTMVEEEALRHVQKLFPQPLGWRPEVRGATFPMGYACAGDKVVPPALEEILNAVEPVDFSDVLQPMSMDDFEALLLRQTDDSSPGITGLTYGHLRAMSRQHRLVYLHLINRFIQFQECPAQWLEVAIALIPKSDGAQGLGSGRPISLIECLFKLATAWVAPRMKAAQRAHRKASDPPAPAPPSGRLHSQQLFDSGEHRGCHQALIILISVMQGLKLQGRPFYLIYTDVKGAFPGVPTEFEGQRYNSMGIEDTDRLYAFLQAIDVNSNIRVRVRHGFSRSSPKGGIGIHQGETLSPGKYSLSLDPLLVYLDKVAAQYDLGIDLGSIQRDHQLLPFEGSYTIDAPHGSVTFYTQGGRLVAIAFADDVCLIAKTKDEAQILLHHAQYYYVAASATLCAPKSVWTGTQPLAPWQIKLSFPWEASDEEVSTLAASCRAWQQGRSSAGGQRQLVPHTDVREVQGSGVILSNDQLYLEGLGDSVRWLYHEKEPLNYSSSLLAYLARSVLSRRDHGGLDVVVSNRPLHLVNPRTGEREYLQWIPPEKPVRYLGIHITATLDWGPEHQVLLSKLNPLLRQIAAGRKLGLAWDVFVQAAATKVFGLVTYHTAVVPFGPEVIASLNDKITAAFRITESASPHQMRCPQPIGLGIPDLVTRTAQQCINLALGALHSNNMEGQALRWCLRTIQGRSRFPWEATSFWVPPKVNGFVEAVSHSLQAVGLLIRTMSPLFPSDNGTNPDDSYELGINLSAPVAHRRRIAHHMHDRSRVSKPTLDNLRKQRSVLTTSGLAQHLLDTQRQPLVRLSRQSLWTCEVLEQPVPELSPFVSISDGTGNRAIGLCQLTGSAPHPIIARVHAGDTPYEAEFAGLIFSLEALLEAGVGADQGEMYSDCQSAMSTYQRTRRSNFNPMAKPHGRCAVLQLYLSVFHPPSPSSDYRLMYIQAHSDEQDQDLISEEDMPLYLGHVQCDRLAVETTKIAPASNVTFFDVDFDFAPCTETDGRRLFCPIESYIRVLSMSSEFHAKRTREPRTGSLGKSWREIQWGKLYRPVIHTPWDSSRAFSPALRNGMDHLPALARLDQIPQLHRGILHGAGKALAPHRLRTLGGRASITELPKRKDRPASADHCPFCQEAPLDSLTHALHECRMDRWQQHCAWASEAVTTMRERYCISSMTALLELHCPLNFTAPTKRDPAPQRGRKRATGSLRPVSFETVQRAQRDKLTPEVATLGATKWFSRMACAIQQKQATINFSKAEGKAFPAVTLLKKACQLQMDELKEAREAWENRVGRKSRNDGLDDDLAFCLRLESRSSKSDQLPEMPLLDKLTMFEQALFSWTTSLNQPFRLYSAQGEAWEGIPSLEGAPLTPLMTSTSDSVASMVYGGWILSPTHLLSLRHNCSRREMFLLGIVPEGVQYADAYKVGPSCWWPEPPSGEGGPRLPEVRSRGRLILWAHTAALPLAEAYLSVPDWLFTWPFLFLDHSPKEARSLEAYPARPSLLLSMAHTLRSCPKGQWWWPEEEGALGQALHSGLWTSSHGNSVATCMPRKEGAQLYATTYWNRGVLLASIMHCREVVATTIRDLDLPTISPSLSKRLSQHANTRANAGNLEADHHGWEGAASQQVNLATVTDPVSGLEVPFVPRRRQTGHQHATPQRFRELLLSYFTSFTSASGRNEPAIRPEVQPWHSLVATGACGGQTCTADGAAIREFGMVLMNGTVLCRECHRKWEHHVRKEMGFHHTPKCPRDVDGRCLSCTTIDAQARPKLRSLLVRDQIRDLTHALFSHLPTNTQGFVSNILYRQARTLHRGQDHSLMISIPAVIHFKILSLLAWHYYDSTVRFIQSVPKHDYAASEPWAMECRKELMLVQLQKRQSPQQTPPEVADKEEEFFRGSPSLKTLKYHLRSHSGLSASLLHTADGCRLLYDRLGIRELSRPDPADWSLRHTSEARCKICQIYEHDLMEVSEVANMGEVVHNCMSCNGWWHESCMAAADRQTLPSAPIDNVEDGVAPPWRCQECVKNGQYAVQRVLEVVRGEDGKFYLLLEYLGYRYLEVRLENRLVDKNSELKRAYREHANTRSSLSLLYCAGAILDAMWHGQSLKELGLETKLVHQDARLYLISHTSLHKRGFAPGMASIIQMLVDQEHRLVIPFSLTNLQCTLEGTRMPMPHGSGEASLERPAEPSLQALANHLTALTDLDTSLPMALAEATKGAIEWEGLGLLSGSSIIDIATALSIFCSQYSSGHWGNLLRQELPELTDEDIEWLCGLTEAMESQEPVLAKSASAQSINPLTQSGRSKRRRRGHDVGTANTFSLSQDSLPSSAPPDAPTTGRKRKTIDPSLPVRRSPRLYSEQSAPGNGRGAQPELDTQSDQVPGQPPPPSPLAASQRPFRKQLSRARRNLHGAGPRATGSLFFLQIFTSFLQFIGEHYSAHGQDQIIFFGTNDLRSTKDWKAVSAALDRNQPTTRLPFRVEKSNHGDNPLTDRSSGIGPMHGIEP